MQKGLEGPEIKEKKDRLSDEGGSRNGLADPTDVGWDGICRESVSGYWIL